MATGTTQDIDFAKQLMNILFCKIWDEQDKAPDEFVDFHADYEEAPDSVKRRINAIFETTVTADRFSGAFDEEDRLTLDAQSVAYIVGEIHVYSLTSSARDALPDAFDTFIRRSPIA